MISILYAHSSIWVVQIYDNIYKFPVLSFHVSDQEYFMYCSRLYKIDIQK